MYLALVTAETILDVLVYSTNKIPSDCNGAKIAVQFSNLVPPKLKFWTFGTWNKLQDPERWVSQAATMRKCPTRDKNVWDKNGNIWNLIVIKCWLRLTNKKSSSGFKSQENQKEYFWLQKHIVVPDGKEKTKSNHCLFNGLVDYSSQVEWVLVRIFWHLT